MGTGSSSGTQQSSIQYTGSPYFDKLLEVMAKDYGTNRATSDLIFGGPRFNNARNFLDQRLTRPEGMTQDEWATHLRGLSSAQARSVRAATQYNSSRPDRNIYRQTGANGEELLWAWDPAQQIYKAHGIRKDAQGQSRSYVAGAWSPAMGGDPPWKPKPEDPVPPGPAQPPGGSTTNSNNDDDYGTGFGGGTNPTGGPGTGGGPGGGPGSYGDSGGTGDPPPPPIRPPDIATSGSQDKWIKKRMTPQAPGSGPTGLFD